MNKYSTIPPKVAAQLAERAKKMEGCLRLDADSDIYTFAVGGMVVVLMSVDSPCGHQYRNLKEATEIRAKIAAQSKEQTK